MNPIEKAVMITGLAYIVGLTSIGISNKNDTNDKNYISYTTQSIIEETSEYVEEEPTDFIEPTINIQDTSFEYNLGNFIEKHQNLETIQLILDESYIKEKLEA